MDLLRLEFYADGRTRAGLRSRSKRDEGRARFLSPEPQPNHEAIGMRRRKLVRSIAYIEDHEPEPSAMEQQVRRLERVLGIALAVNPEQPVELKACFRCGLRIEGSTTINPCTALACVKGTCKDGNHQRRPVRGRRASDFAQRRPRKTALQESIYFVNTTGEGFAGVELTETK